MKKIILALCFGVLCLLPSVSWAECMDIGFFDSFTLVTSEGGFKYVVLYAGSMPVARFSLQSCTVKPSSKIQLLKTNVCDGDEILIDGKPCIMMDIKPLGP